MNKPLIVIKNSNVTQDHMEAVALLSQVYAKVGSRVSIVEVDGSNVTYKDALGYFSVSVPLQGELENFARLF
jgi:hypothetical protein